MNVGERIGRLEIVSLFKDSRYYKFASCRCDCGKTKDIRVSSIEAGFTRSCGCIASERIARANFRHGMARSPEWIVFRAMHQRCEYTRHKSYADYGGRGIKICERWSGESGFINFVADMGSRPSLSVSIDRINNAGNYEPGNCRWATAKEQAANRRPARPRKPRQAVAPPAR